MGKKRYRKWGIGLCALIVAVLVGCQSIAGFSFDDAILKQLAVTAQESSGSIQLTIDWNQEMSANETDPQMAKLLPLLSNLKLDIKNSKYDAQGRAQMTGALTLGDKRPIPFTLHTDGKKLKMEIEGAKQPFVISLSESAGQWVPGMPGLATGGADQVSLAEPIRKLVKTVAGYFVRNLPNPGKLEVARGESLVNGETVTLNKIHAELDGQQMGELLIQYVNALVKDEQGFKDMVKGFAKWMAELPPELKKSVFGEDAAMPVVSDEEIQKVFDELYPMLKQAQDGLAEQKNSPEWALIFDKGITLKTDLYVDDQLHLRKSDTDLVIAPEAFKADTFPVRSIRLRTVSENWNVNGDIAVPDIEEPLSAIGPAQLENMQTARFLRMFDESSAVYGLLKNDLQIDDTSFEMQSGGWSDAEPYMVKKGTKETVYVPVRAVLNEFNIPLTYSAGTEELRFTDSATWQEIVLHVGSGEAVVNAGPQKLSEPVHRHGSAMYMAADDLFKLLKATYEYQVTKNGEVVVQVKRDM